MYFVILCPHESVPLFLIKSSMKISKDIAAKDDDMFHEPCVKANQSPEVLGVCDKEHM